MEWLGDAAIQVGASDARPPAQTAPFLAGFIDGLIAHAAVRDAELLDIDGLPAGQQSNPTRHVRFRFLADSYALAERLAASELRGSGIRGGVEALDRGLRQFGWMLCIDVAPT